MPNAHGTIIWASILEWFVVRCGSKNGYYTYMCSRVIGQGMCSRYVNQSNFNGQNDFGGGGGGFTRPFFEHENIFFG